MYNYQSPQIPKKLRQNYQLSNQQKNTLQKQQDDGSNPNIYHFTASFGVQDSQQGAGVKNFFKTQSDDLYYKTQQGRNFEYQQQMADNRIYNDIPLNNSIQNNYTQNDIINQIEHNDPKVEQNQFNKQNPNQLLLRSSEFNEDTLQQQYYSSLNGQSQQSLQDQSQQVQSQYNVQDKNKKQSENKIYKYIQQMVDNTQSIQEAQNQIQSFVSQPSTFSRRDGSQHVQNYQTEEQEVERAQPPPIPELQPSCQITYSEIAFLKQKQRQASIDKLKESKQQKVLNEIAHFYRQLAENKKLQVEGENGSNQLVSPSKVRKSESQNKLTKNQQVSHVQRKIKSNNQTRQIHSQSTSNLFKKDDIQNSQLVSVNQLKQKNNDRQSRDEIVNKHSQSVQLSYMNNSQYDDTENQENIQQSSNRLVERNIQLPLQKRNNIKNIQQNKQVSFRNNSLQDHQDNTKQSDQLNQLQNNDSLMKMSGQNEELKISLVEILNLSPVQLQTYESKIKKQDYLTQKNNLTGKYKQLEEYLKYSNGRQNYLSSVNQSMKSLGAKYAFRINLVYELQLIGKISKKYVLEGIKEVIELSDSYETIIQDIQSLEAGKNSRRNLRTVAQKEKDDQTIVVLKDMQIRIAQKIFYIYLSKVQLKYKKEIYSQLTSFEQAGNRLRLQLALNVLKHYKTIQQMKKWLLNSSKKELQIKKMKKVFDAIKAKGQKYNYYKPFIQKIVNNHRNILKQNTLISLFENLLKQKTKQRKFELCKQINNSHLFTKSFLILKAFINRKKNNQVVQTMNAKNITLKYTSELLSIIHQHTESNYKQHFKSRFQDNANIKNNNDQQTYGQLHYSDLENSQQVHYQNSIKRYEDSNNRDLSSRNISSKEIKGPIHLKEKQENESDFLDQTYDSKQFQKHFYCDEEFLSSARNLLEVKRQITLDKLDRLKNANLYLEDQTSFLQRNKDKVQEQNREENEVFIEDMIYLQSDSKMNLIQIPQQTNKDRLQQETKQNNKNTQRDQLKESRLDDQRDCKAILTLKQHIKQIIRVLKRLSQKKESFKFKNPIDLLLRKESASDKFSSDNDSISKQKNNMKHHPLNQHLEMIKHIEQSERKQICSYLFYHWKIIFLERTLEAEISLLNSLKKCKQVLLTFKSRYRENSEICSIKQQIRHEKIKSTVFSEWAKMGIERMEINNSKLSFFYKKLCFRRILFFSTYSKVKKGANNFYQTSRMKGILQGWSNISRENSQVRQLYKKQLKKHFFSHWKYHSTKISFLRRFWKRILFTPDEYLFDRYGNKKNLLKQILKNWRGIVIENENSMKQKLALKSSIQHRDVVQKTKAFFEWLKCVRIRKGLIKLFQSNIIKKVFSNKIIKPWKDVIHQQQQIILQFRRKVNINNLLTIFHFLKIKAMQRKMTKCFYLKKFFTGWKQYKEYRQEILPRSYRQRKILKLFLTSLIQNQLGEVRYRAKTEKSTKYFLYHIKKFMQTCLKLWLKYTEKRKSKKSLKAKLSKYAEKNLKKRMFTSFKLIRIMARLKVVQNQKAIEFRQLQYEKKYNLQRLTNDPHLNPQLQEVLQIIHRWKAFAIKQKSIKFIQSRIQKFHQRKALTNYFNKWQILYNQRMSLNQEDASQIEYINDKLYNQKRKQQEKTVNNQLKKQDNIISYKQIKQQDNIKSNNEYQKEQQIINVDNSQDKQKYASENKSNQNSVNNQHYSSEKIFTHQRVNSFSQNSHLSIQENTQDQLSNRFQRSHSRSTIQATSRSNSPNYAKGSLKPNIFQDNHRKSRKSVRFELNSGEQQSYPSALTSHRLDYFDQKYNENEAFYHKLLSQRTNTSQM